MESPERACRPASTSVQTKARSMAFGRRVDRRRHSPVGWVALLALVSTLLVGCSIGGSSEGEPEVTVAPTIEPTAEPVTRFGEVTWATAVEDTGAPAEDLEAFPRDTETIHAVVPVENAPAGETITARWSMDGVTIDAIDATVTIDEATQAGWVTFALTWEGDALWPVGTLGVDITAASGATVRGEIQIEST